MRVFGVSDMGDFFARTKDMNLNGHMDRIKAPFLVTHGETDRQINVKYALQAYEQLVNSPRSWVAAPPDIDRAISSLLARSTGCA